MDRSSNYPFEGVNNDSFVLFDALKKDGEDAVVLDGFFTAKELEEVVEELKKGRVK